MSSSAENPRKRATHAILRLREQRMLAQVDGAASRTETSRKRGRARSSRGTRGLVEALDRASARGRAVAIGALLVAILWANTSYNGVFRKLHFAADREQAQALVLAYKRLQGLMHERPLRLKYPSVAPPHPRNRRPNRCWYACVRDELVRYAGL